VPEREFEQIRRRFRAARARPAGVVRRPGGRYNLDVHWATYATGTEIHGTQHLQIPTWDADLDRHNELTTGGRRILQFSSYSVRHRRDHVGAIVVRALGQAGWR
jgi:very-short-patch-repair endonuclease